MSVEAQAWALNTRVGDATRKLILWGLANHAHKDGRNAWASVESLAEYGECAGRTVQRHTAALLDQGLIREGDQSAIPDYVPKRYRPIVFDLAMSEATAEQWRAERAAGGRRAESAAIGAAGGRAGAAARWKPRGDSTTPLGDDESSRGDNVTPLRGDNLSPLNPDLRGDSRGDTRGDTAVSPKPKENQEKTEVQSQRRGRAARSADDDGRAGGEQASTSASASGRSSGSGTTRGCRLPGDWRPTHELVAEAAEDAPDVDQLREFRRFRDHWLGAPGQKGIKRDWPATYRNWMRNEQDKIEDRRRRFGSGGQQPARRTAADERLDAGLDIVARLEAQERAEEEAAAARARVVDVTVSAIGSAETTDQPREVLF